MATRRDVPGVTLTAPEIAYLAASVGWTGDDIAVAVAIVLAESGGVTNAFRPESANPGGGNDRGLWQINDKAHPWTKGKDDLAVYHPFMATRFARDIYDRSGGWGAWNYGPKAYSGKSRTLDLAPGRAAAAAPVDPTPRLAAAGLDGKPEGIGAVDIATRAGGAVLDAVGNVIPWANGLATLLAAITSGAWWRRIGVGALGAGLVVVAIAVANRGILTRGMIPT